MEDERGVLVGEPSADNLRPQNLRTWILAKQDRPLLFPHIPNHTDSPLRLHLLRREQRADSGVRSKPGQRGPERRGRAVRDGVE